MKFDFGFIILSPNFNIGGLKNTLRSITNNYDNKEIICCVSNLVNKDQFSEMKENCDVYKGGKTITSLINKGFEKINSEWGILILEGSRIYKNIDNKYNKWIKDYKDVLFPLIVDRDRELYPTKIYNAFYNCTLNGLCINKKLFKEIGKFNEESLEDSRKIWSIKALEKNVIFKSILGIKIC